MVWHACTLHAVEIENNRLPADEIRITIVSQIAIPAEAHFIIMPAVASVIVVHQQAETCLAVITSMLLRGGITVVISRPPIRKAGCLLPADIIY